MRRLLLPLGLCLAVFGAAFAARAAFVPDVVAVAYAEAPQSIWALETAFVLESIENVALLGAALMIALIVGKLVWPLIGRSPPKPEGQEERR